MTRDVAEARGPLRGEAKVPGDKSIGHRALILGSLTERGLRVRNLPRGLDVRSTRRCLGRLGVAISGDEDETEVLGDGIGFPWRSSGSTLDCGNSGTTMRLLMGVLAGMPVEVVLAGDPSLSRRPMRRVAEPLLRMGASIALDPAGCAPVRVAGRRPLRGVRYRLPVASAQVKSAVLLAGLLGEGETVVEDPFGTRDHTERMLRWLAPASIRTDGEVVTVRADALPGGHTVTLPGDLSSAAFFVGAAAIVPGSDVVLPGVGVNPTRGGFLDVLREWGARIDLENAREVAGEPVADLRARWAPLRGGTVPAGRIPRLVDEVPLLAVVAATAEGTTRLAGLAELRHKESDRIVGTAEGLRAMGAAVRVEGDDLVVEGPSRLRGARVETLGDHRLAMAFSVAALAARGTTTLSDARCAHVSYPGFFEDLLGLAA